MNTDNTQAKSTAEVMNEQAQEIARLRQRNEELANAAMRADAREQRHQNAIELYETAEPEELKVRAADMHRINFLIHHAESITVAGCGTIAGDDLLMLRATLDTWRGARRESKPLRAPARS